MEDQARALIAEHLGRPVAQLSAEESLLALGADSLDLVSLTMAIEEAFDIHVPDEQAETCRTVGDVLQLVADRCAARCAPASAGRELAGV
jgi:acyl carrier protein